jgi:predicted nucleotidyltransferase
LWRRRVPAAPRRNPARRLSLAYVRQVPYVRTPPWTAKPSSPRFAPTRPPGARGTSRTPRCSVRARGDNRADSDIDIMIEIAPEARVGVFEYVEITQTIADLFPALVDVSNRRKLKPFVRPSAEREAVPAF